MFDRLLLLFCVGERNSLLPRCTGDLFSVDKSEFALLSTVDLILFLLFVGERDSLLLRCAGDLFSVDKDECALL